MKYENMLLPFEIEDGTKCKILYYFSLFIMNFHLYSWSRIIGAFITVLCKIYKVL